MTRSEAQAILERITYKPGWHIDPWGDPMEDFTGRLKLRIQFDAPDSESGRTRTFLHRRSMLAPLQHYPDEESFLRFVLEVLIDVERHEAAEFFKLDGKIVFSPHTPEGGRYA